MPDTDRCPCGTGEPYARCCGRYHRAGSAPTAEKLMRSRYSAFALGDPEYLSRTWHPSTCPAVLDLDPDLRWTGLEILATVRGSMFDDAGTVEFRAHHRQGRAGGSLHETSRFVREQGTWFYLDGDVE